MGRGKHNRGGQQQQGYFAGLATRPPGQARGRGRRGDGDVAQLHARGLSAALHDAPSAAAWAGGDEALVPCGDETVDRFDGRLLLDDVARWEPRGGGARAAGDGDGGEGAEGAALDFERYRDLQAPRARAYGGGYRAPYGRGAPPPGGGTPPHGGGAPFGSGAPYGSGAPFNSGAPYSSGVPYGREEGGEEEGGGARRGCGRGVLRGARRVRPGRCLRMPSPPPPLSSLRGGVTSHAQQDCAHPLLGARPQLPEA